MNTEPQVERPMSIRDPQDRIDQSLELFDVLFRNQIEGLPEQITRMSVHLEINSSEYPFMFVETAVLDDNGLFVVNESRTGIKKRVERYHLDVFNGKVTARRDSSQCDSQ